MPPCLFNLLYFPCFVSKVVYLYAGLTFAFFTSSATSSPSTSWGWKSAPCHADSQRHAPGRAHAPARAGGWGLGAPDGMQPECLGRVRSESGTRKKGRTQYTVYIIYSITYIYMYIYYLYIYIYTLFIHIDIYYIYRHISMYTFAGTQTRTPTHRLSHICRASISTLSCLT